VHVVCLAVGAGIGVGAGGLIGLEIDVSRVEARNTLIMIIGLSCFALLGLYFERRITAKVAHQVARLDTERDGIFKEGVVEGYVEAVHDRLP